MSDKKNTFKALEGLYTPLIAQSSGGSNICPDPDLSRHPIQVRAQSCYDLGIDNSRSDNILRVQIVDTHFEKQLTQVFYLDF
jgi:hypothetical protein